MSAQRMTRGNLSVSPKVSLAARGLLQAASLFLLALQTQNFVTVVSQQLAHFRDRCPHAFSKCTEEPELKARSGDPEHTDRCFLDPEKKKSLRIVSTGEIGLEAPAA